MKQRTLLFVFLLLSTLMASAQTDLTGATVTLDSSAYDYDGTAHCPKVSSIRWGRYRYNTLVEGTDYDIAYEDNVNAGEATATLTFKGDYTGTATRTFTISPKDLSREGIKMELNETEFVYDGTEKKPAVSDLYYGGKLLVNGVDYDISYENNISPGTATATVTFKGNYTGSVSESFYITIKPGTDVIIKGSCGDNVSYSLDTSTGVLNITGTGAMTNYYYDYTPWFSYISYIKTVEIFDGVTSIGEGAFAYCTCLTEVTIPNSVTTIGIQAFFECSSLTSITIPNSVTEIRNETFRNCSSLTSVTIPNSVTSIGNYAFQSSRLTSVTIPNSVTSIGEGAFEYCSGLTSVIIPNSVTAIGFQAFHGCSGLTSVTIGNGVTSIGGGAFAYCSGLKSITIPNSVTTIGESIFKSCSGLTSVKIGSSVKSIGKQAFSYCSKLEIVYCYAEDVPLTDSNAFYNSPILSASLHVPAVSLEAYKTTSPWSGFGNIVALTEDIYYSFDTGTKQATVISGDTKYTGSVTIPETVTYDGVTYSVVAIDNDAFYSCRDLTSVTIPNSVTSIGSYAFAGCSGLTSLTIPNSVASISVYAFNYCSGLTEIIVESGNTAYDSRDNCNAIIETATNKLIIGCKNTIIPTSVTEIEYEAFRYCSELTDITIPNSVTIIGQGAFYDCSNLTEVTIPNSVTTIYRRAFYQCSGLTSVSIGSSVTSIGWYSFYNCSGLTDVYCYAESVPATDSDAFNSSPISSATLHVPAASVVAYRATEPWSGFGNIVAISDALRGDVNGDGTVNGTDIQAIINLIVDGEYDEKADVNTDGIVNGTDIQEVINIIVHAD